MSTKLAHARGTAPYQGMYQPTNQSSDIDECVHALGRSWYKEGQTITTVRLNAMWTYDEVR
eukprot:6069-Eustigmatos_ZCMA.PRE.1